MARRLELLGWARESGAWIIEDDYASEFRYGGRPLASLQRTTDSLGDIDAMSVDRYRANLGARRNQREAGQGISWILDPN
jgi:DNA-binding transcriptional MocR family regulator